MGCQYVSPPITYPTWVNPLPDMLHIRSIGACLNLLGKIIPLKAQSGGEATVHWLHVVVAGTRHASRQAGVVRESCRYDSSTPKGITSAKAIIPCRAQTCARDGTELRQTRIPL